MDSPASCRISVPGSTQVPVRPIMNFEYGALTLCGRLSHTFLLSILIPRYWPYNPDPQAVRFGLLPVRSPLLGEFFLFLWVLRCFSSPGALPLTYIFSQRCWRFAPAGFPIRISPGRSPVNGYPELFAVSHVLHRHFAPRHPP